MKRERRPMTGSRGPGRRNGALLCFLMVLAAAVTMSACDRRAAADREGVAAVQSTAAGAARQEPVASPPSIEGTWVRPSPSGGGLREALVLEADGTASFVGIPSLKALTWNLDDGYLTLETNQIRYPQPRPIGFDVAELTADRLVLSAEGDYLAGEYHRDDHAVSVVSGSVVYDGDEPFPDAAVLVVALEDVTWQEANGEVVADAAFPVAGKKAPVAFRIRFFTDQILPARTYSVRPSIIVNGQQRFKNTHANLVLTQGHPNHLEVALTHIQEVDPAAQSEISREAVRPPPAARHAPSTVKQRISL
jgi:uncharacterized lipoprotein YbaY